MGTSIRLSGSTALCLVTRKSYRTCNQVPPGLLVQDDQLCWGHEKLILVLRLTEPILYVTIVLIDLLSFVGNGTHKSNAMSTSRSLVVSKRAIFALSCLAALLERSCSTDACRMTGAQIPRLQAPLHGTERRAGRGAVLGD